MATSMRNLTLYAPASESLQVDLYCTEDPTGTAPAFVLTREGTVLTSESFTAGSWVGTYGSDGWTVARTPKIGATSDLAVVSGLRYWLWAKQVAGGESAIDRVGLIIVP